MNQDLADTRGGISSDRWGQGLLTHMGQDLTDTPGCVSADPWRSPSTLPSGSFPGEVWLPWSP